MSKAKQDWTSPLMGFDIQQECIDLAVSRHGFSDRLEVVVLTQQDWDAIKALVNKEAPQTAEKLRTMGIPMLPLAFNRNKQEG